MFISPLLVLICTFFTATRSAWPMLARSGGTGGSNIYRRYTPAPMVWTHLRKSNITTEAIPRLEDLLAAAVANRTRMQTHPSFLQADPLMIRNGLYLSRPLRAPPQAFVNAAVAENVRGIQGDRLFRAQKAETRRLKKEFAKGFNELVRKA